MSYHLRHRIRLEVEKSRARDAIIDVGALAALLSQEIDGESSTTAIMLQRLIIDECAHAGIGMRVGGSPLEKAHTV
ncbi:hypothetical protein U0C82_00255 [Fulvimarina sp. 2208YS6-2-32]|uniref:Uncharacterized protein n=1 Tax=Fulvimarina uroteuthidis TaxID=3098149 RepID=A0ABU5HWR0_9HYPH|nr:hypothetical protein [Fulvimarina sp. 2208YS6-2-32]MDY8107578.1 hypothetical protein [Fulvimarina sp. 2208YS6-2-32]